MKPLTQKEIQFIKSTGWTPTVEQNGQWDNTIFPQNVGPNTEPRTIDADGYVVDKYAEKVHDFCLKCYGIDTYELYKKCVDEIDNITLEYDATYLFYLFFTREELEQLTDEKATKWLKDFKYYCGYRKWDRGNLGYVNEALSVYEGVFSFYVDNDNTVSCWDHEPWPLEDYTKLKVVK